MKTIKKQKQIQQFGIRSIIELYLNYFGYFYLYKKISK